MDGPFRSAAARQAIEAEAARRFLAARASDTDAAWDAAYRWIEEDPAHGYAFARIEAGWDLSARLSELPAARRGADDDDDPGDVAEAASAPRRPIPTRLLDRRIAMGAMAAALVAGTAGIALGLGDGGERYRTGIGARRVVRLADGSVVRLNTNSEIAVEMRRDRRSIRLVRGEAAFDVAHDRARPFVVAADEARVRAVGTAFTVRLRDDLTEVTVTQGIVGVRDGGEGERRIGAGAAAAVRKGAIAVTPLDPPAIERRLAWQRGRLSFDGEPLAQAVEEFNRYRDTPIVIGDPDLAGIRIGGTFFSSRSGDFVDALEQSFGIQAISGGDGSLLLIPAARG